MPTHSQVLRFGDTIEDHDYLTRMLPLLEEGEC